MPDDTLPRAVQKWLNRSLGVWSRMAEGSIYYTGPGGHIGATW